MRQPCIADLVVGACGVNSGAGVSYVIFGAYGIGSSGTLPLSNLTGLNGFKITGVTAGDRSGYSVSSVGDVNADGIADLIVGAPGANSAAGASYVVFGAHGIGSSGVLSLANLTGFNGFKITGDAAGDNSGYSVSSAGDINADGVNDLIIGAPSANNAKGASYVIFGVGSSFTASLSASLTSTLTKQFTSTFTKTRRSTAESNIVSSTSSQTKRFSSTFTKSELATPTESAFVLHEAVPGLQLLTNGPSLEVIANGTVNLAIQLLSNTIGQFVPDNTHNVSMQWDGLTLFLSGSPSALNGLLRVLQFALLNDAGAYRASVVYLDAFLVDANATRVNGYGNLTQFISHEPPALNGTFPNVTVNLNTRFSVDLAALPARFVGVASDVLTYNIGMADGSSLPGFVEFYNNIVGGQTNARTVLNFAAWVGNQYRQYSLSQYFSVIYTYVPVATAKVILPQVCSTSVNCMVAIDPNTFTEPLNALTFSANTNGFPLPPGILLNPQTLSFGVYMTTDWAGNVTVVARDGVGGLARATFLLTIFDAPPVARPFATQYGRALKTSIIPIPETAFTSSKSLTLSLPSLADGSPVPAWSALNTILRQITVEPPASMLSKVINFLLCAGDGYKITCTNVSFSVLPNEPLEIGTVLAPLSGTVGQQVTYYLPQDAFLSPVNNSILISLFLGPQWLQLIGNTLSGTPDAVGSATALIVGNDALGGLLNQTLQIIITETFSAWLWDWLSWVVAITGVITFVVAPFIYTYRNRNRLCNCIEGDKLEDTRPFANLDAYNKSTYKISTSEPVYVIAYRNRKPEENNFFKRALIRASKPISSYFHDKWNNARLTSGADLPPWMEFNDVDNKIYVYKHLIPAEAEPLRVEITTVEGRKIAVLAVNPAEVGQDAGVVVLNVDDDSVVLEVPTLMGREEDREMTPLEIDEQPVFPERELSIVLSEPEPEPDPEPTLDPAAERAMRVERNSSQLSLGIIPPVESLEQSRVSQREKSTTKAAPPVLSGSKQTLWHNNATTASNDPLDLFDERVEL